MVMKGNGNFESERNLREFRENLRENLSSREILEKWKCDENGLPEKTALRLPCNYFIYPYRYHKCQTNAVLLTSLKKCQQHCIGKFRWYDLYTKPIFNF